MPNETNLNFISFRFKGILITSNFDRSSKRPDLSFGEWIGSDSDTQFKVLRRGGNCGITHRNNNAKTGSYTFYFNPDGDSWKENGFRAVVVVSTKTVHDFEIMP